MQLTAAAVTPPAEHAARRPAGATDAAAADAGVRHVKRMQKPSSNIAILVLLLATLNCVHSDGTDLQVLVLKYCALDSAGVRLSSTSYDQIKPLVSGIEESAWDCCDVIAGYRAEPACLDSDSSASVAVQYKLLGSLLGSTWQPVKEDSSQGAQERVAFHVIRNSRLGWRIDGPSIRPHVSPGALAAHLEGLLAREPDRSRTDPELAQALAALRKLGQKGRSE